MDRYGALPGPVENLIEVAELKALCIQHGVATAAIRRGECRMKFASTAQVDRSCSNSGGGRVWERGYS